MGLLKFLFGKNEEDVLQTNDNRQSVKASILAKENTTKITSQSNILFSKEELSNVISYLVKVANIFHNSVCLKQTGGDRHLKMENIVHSYLGIFGYYYEVKYKYGSFDKLVNTQIAQSFLLVRNAMNDTSNEKDSIRHLAENWSDILNTISILQLEPNPDGEKISTMQSEITKITYAVEKLSGKKCQQPHNKSYNPYNITENASMAVGHSIPDVSDVFLRELLPQLASAKYVGKSKQDIVANYAISMIESYCNNASFVPMCIVKSITSQVQSAAQRIDNIDYSPYSNLQELILSKIYR